MSRHDHPLSPEQRRYELATILGRGLRRLLRLPRLRRRRAAAFFPGKTLGIWRSLP